MALILRDLASLPVKSALDARPARPQIMLNYYISHLRCCQYSYASNSGFAVNIPQSRRNTREEETRCIGPPWPSAQFSFRPLPKLWARRSHGQKMALKSWKDIPDRLWRKAAGINKGQRGALSTAPSDSAPAALLLSGSRPAPFTGYAAGSSPRGRTVCLFHSAPAVMVQDARSAHS